MHSQLRAVAVGSTAAEGNGKIARQLRGRVGVQASYRQWVEDFERLLGNSNEPEIGIVKRAYGE